MLLILSAALAAGLVWLRIPAALLLGPMLAGLAVAGTGGAIRVSPPVLLLAQGLMGCMMAQMTAVAVGREMLNRMPLIAIGVLSVIIATSGMALLMSRLRILPRSETLWGLSPGAATAMIIMSESHGADARLVAFMQYTRVAAVAAVASLIAKFAYPSGVHTAPAINWFPPVHPLYLFETLVLAIAGPVLGNALRLRSGALLVPLTVGIVLIRLGWITIELPPALLVCAYGIVGWSVGLRFTRALLLHAAQALPRIVLCTLALLLLCGAIGALLVLVAHIDPLTAYLATSPGGADTVAVIAASSTHHIDVPFIMAMQAIRMIMIILLAPTLFRWLSGSPAGLVSQSARPDA